MKPNFALSLSFDGLRLMHRVEGGWHLVGDVALDNPDMTGALARLKAAGEALEPGKVSTKLLIPNDQIKYIALDTTRAEEDDVRAALHGATPYAVDELVYDFTKGGGRTYVAAVAKETLDEAREFAEENGFNPVSFAAVPEPFTYVGEAHFGAVSGQNVERDDEAVVIIGEAAVDMPPEPVSEDRPDPTPTSDAEPEVETADTAKVPDETAVDVPETVDPAPAESEPEVLEPEQPDEDAAVPEPEPETPDVEDVTRASNDEESVAETEDASEIDEAPEPEADPAVEQPDTSEAAPLFASRLRADRNEGRPTPPVEEAKPAAAGKPDRAEPTFGRRTPPCLAVPTGQGTDPMPPLSAPSRDGDAPAPAPSLTIETAEPDAVPAITGDAATALPPEAAVAAASLTVEPDPVDPTQDEPQRGAAASAMGAASAVGGAVGGMFASRRMARAKAKDEATQAAPEAGTTDEKARQTVFGARKKPQPKPKAVVGGKPRFLGLILTAVLLLFLLAIAAFAALSDEGIARWFGFGSSDTQIAETPSQSSDPAAPEVAAATPDTDAEPADAPDALAIPTAPTGGQVLTPEEAQRIYAATGVWQRAPRIPLIPRTTTLEDLQVASAPRPVVRVPPSPLANASSVAGDAVIAAPIDPPPPSATFDFDERGLVVATPDGAVTPDGILVIVGRPPLNPPTRPGTVAPEVTPQDQLAAVVPDTATPVADAPEGVIVIAGRPAIEPPVRPGTAAPAPAPEAEALAAGDAPLVARDGLLVLAGAPPVLPPVRPGTRAPNATPDDVPDVAIQTPPTDPQAEGLNVIAGPPPILPPARPGTVAPQEDAAAQSLSLDVASALTSGTAQVPDANTPRPLPRPAAIIEAAATRANTPVLGALTAAQAAAFRPRTRPAGLAPAPTPEPEPVVEQAAAPAGLQIAPEIAAAVQAAANRPNPIVNPTSQAVAASVRPDPRPRNMQRIVQRAAAAQQRAAAQVATAAPRAVAPSGPTAGSVATNATLQNAINLREVNLIGIYGGSGDRRALVRLANGRYTRVTVGDRLDGGRVTAISAGALSYTKRGRAITLEVPG